MDAHSTVAVTSNLEVFNEEYLAFFAGHSPNLVA